MHEQLWPLYILTGVFGLYTVYHILKDSNYL